jgi:hypothetical protein
MTIDVDPPVSSIPSFIVEEGVFQILKLLDKYAIKATFFIPAVTAQKFPIAIKEIKKRGHEIASHGLKHHPDEATLSLNKQIQMIKTATEIIESISGSRPIGYRAPLFKVNENCWMALQKNHYLYDSSVVYSPFYGRFRKIFPIKPFQIRIKHYNYCDLTEIPVSVNPFIPLPLGGTWMRIFGLKWCKIGIKMNFTFQTPVVFYVHPKDVIPRTYGRKWHYYRNTTNCMKTLEEIIKYAIRNRARFLKACELTKVEC